MLDSIFVLAALPLVCFFLLILAAKRSVLFSILCSLGVLIAVSAATWEISLGRMLSASGKGIFIATEIILIVIGALLILESLNIKNLFVAFRNFFHSISRDKRIHAILVGWALVHFLEGAAGFGTPAMVAVPIFIALGFSPLLGVTLSLIGDSIPVIFGAVGLPVTYGIASPLASMGISNFSVEALTRSIAQFNVAGSLLIPILLIATLTLWEKKPARYFWKFVPFALISGLSVSLPALATAYVSGPELPSIVGGLLGFFVISFMARRRFLVPADSSEDIAEIPPASPEPVKQTKSGIGIAFSPYLVAVALLLVSRMPFFPLKEYLLSAFPLRIESIAGYGIQYVFYPFYSAGMILLFSALLSFFILKLRSREIREVAKKSFQKIIRPYVILSLVLIFVQIFAYSGENASGHEAMPIVLAREMGNIAGELWPLVAPFVGALGSFTAGSATVSNLIFSGLQYENAIISGFNPTLILSLQGLGAAAGNMIALHNVIAALAVAGILHRESDTVRRNIVPLFIYLLLIGLLGLMLSLV